MYVLYTHTSVLHTHTHTHTHNTHAHTQQTHTHTHTHTHTRSEEIACGIKGDAVHGFRVFGESVHVLALKFSLFVLV